MPALLTRPSTPPPCSRLHAQARSTIAGMRAKSVASKGRIKGPFPTRAASLASAASLRPERISFAPAWPNATASASPMPDEAPVIHQTLRSNIPASRYEIALPLNTIRASPTKGRDDQLPEREIRRCQMRQCLGDQHDGVGGIESDDDVGAHLGHVGVHGRKAAEIVAVEVDRVVARTRRHEARDRVLPERAL